MSESTTPSEHDPAAEDDMRQHSQADTEGGEATPGQGEDVPREHTEDPAEG